MKIVDSLPVGLDYFPTQTSPPPPYFSFTGSSSTIITGTWTLPNLANGQTITVTLPAVPSSQAIGKRLTNKAKVTSSNLQDRNLSNNTASTDFFVSGLEIAKTKPTSVSYLTVGVPFTYTITVNNTSTSSASGVVISDVFDPGLSVTGAKLTVGTSQLLLNLVLYLFAGKIGLKEAGEVLGWFHDLGKASEKFQRYILSGEGFIDPDAEEYIDPIAHKGKIDHTTAGAQVIYETLWNKGPKEKIAAQILALCIASHHSGLIDCLKPDGENNFKRRMGKDDESTRKAEALSNLQEIADSLEDLLGEKIIEQIFDRLQSLKEEANESSNTWAFKAGLLVRYLLSCLLDADRLDTADFESPGNARFRNYGQYHPWEVLIERLNGKLKQFEKKKRSGCLACSGLASLLRFCCEAKGNLSLVLRRMGRPLTSGRQALVLWLLVALLLGHAVVGAAERVPAAAIPETVTVVLTQIATTAPAVLLAAGLLLLLMRRRVARPRAFALTEVPRFACGVPLTGHVLRFSARPPPRLLPA